MREFYINLSASSKSHIVVYSEVMKSTEGSWKRVKQQWESFKNEPKKSTSIQKPPPPPPFF